MKVRTLLAVLIILIAFVFVNTASAQAMPLQSGQIVWVGMSPDGWTYVISNSEKFGGLHYFDVSQVGPDGTTMQSYLIEEQPIQIVIAACGHHMSIVYGISYIANEQQIYMLQVELSGSMPCSIQNLVYVPLMIK